MSKNTAGSKGLESLQVLVTPTVEAEVIDAIANRIMALPEYPVIETVQGLLIQKNELLAEEKRIRSEAGDMGVQLPEIKSRIARLNGDISNMKADAKNGVLNKDGISDIRTSILNVKRLSDFLEEFAMEELEKSANYSRIHEELRGLVSKATDYSKKVAEMTARANELHQHAEELGTEARSLLLSVSAE